MPASSKHPLSCPPTVPPLVLKRDKCTVIGIQVAGGGGGGSSMRDSTAKPHTLWRTAAVETKGATTQCYLAAKGSGNTQGQRQCPSREGSRKHARATGTTPGAAAAYRGKGGVSAVCLWRTVAVETVAAVEMTVASLCALTNGLWARRHGHCGT